MRKKTIQLITMVLAAAFLILSATLTDSGLAQETGKSTEAVNPGNPGGPGGPGGWGRDWDGDGIPNGRDPDYDRQNPMRGNGQMGYIDENGDGINDRCLFRDGSGIRYGWSSRHGQPGGGAGYMHRDGYGDRGNGPWGGRHSGPRGGMCIRGQG